jgi:hypothetical protein
MSEQQSSAVSAVSASVREAAERVLATAQSADQEQTQALGALRSALDAEPQTAPPMLCGVCGEWHQEAAGYAPPLRAERERRMVAEISFDPTNHHNALKCPYCNPKGLAFAEPQTAPSDIERAFQDACDEAGCAYDNEALLEAIHALKERCQAEIAK